jgi:hypothetical protein
VFSSSYKNYKLFIKTSAVTNANDSIALKFRAAGTDSTTGLSGVQGFAYSAAAGIAVVTSNASNFGLGPIGSTVPGTGQMNFDIFSPNLAENTTATGLSMGTSNFYFTIYASGYAADTTQYDGFTIFATGNFSATIEVYGYGN